MKGLLLIIVALSSLCVKAQQFQPVDDKSSIAFTIKNFGVNTGGHFSRLSGSINFDKASPDKAAFNINVAAATVNTGNDSRDNHLKKEEYFDAENHPAISFVSEKIVSKGSGFSVSGKLTIKGTAKDISFPFTASAKEDGYLFEGSFQINRRDFKVGGNSVVLGNNVTVTLSVFAKKKE